METIPNTSGYKIPNGKIYRIVCPNNYCYIGSTINELNYRFRLHKHHSKRNDSPLYRYLNTIDISNVKIELVENYPCNTMEELRQKETEYIKKEKLNNINCLNKNVAFLSHDDLLIKKRARHHANKEIENEKRRNRRIRQLERETKETLEKH